MSNGKVFGCDIFNRLGPPARIASKSFSNAPEWSGSPAGFGETPCELFAEIHGTSVGFTTVQMCSDVFAYCFAYCLHNTSVCFLFLFFSRKERHENLRGFWPCGTIEYPRAHQTKPGRAGCQAHVTWKVSETVHFVFAKQVPHIFWDLGVGPFWDQ